MIDRSAIDLIEETRLTPKDFPTYPLIVNPFADRSATTGEPEVVISLPSKPKRNFDEIKNVGE